MRARQRIRRHIQDQTITITSGIDSAVIVVFIHNSVAHKPMSYMKSFTVTV